MPDMTQLLQTGATAALQTLLPQQQAPAAPQVTYVQPPKSSINWLLWGGIAAAGIVGLIVLKKVMGGKGGSAAAAPTATNPRRRRKVRISRRRR